MEGLKVSESDMVVYVNPSKSTNVHDTVLRELSSLLFKYNDHFDGVLLAYEFDILNNNSRILTGIHPHFCVNLNAKLFLFSPKPKMLSEGKVVKVTQGSIHVVVLGFASAVIAEDDIRREFSYKVKHEEEVFSSNLHKRHVIKVGTMIRFLIKSFSEEIVHISGSLVPDNTGSIQWLARHNDPTINSKETTRAIKDETGSQDLGALSMDASSNNHSRTKKSKKAKIQRED